MRVIAFSCCHLATPETQQYLFCRELDYAPVRRLAEIIIETQPDKVINLGDFCESYYDDPDYWRELMPEFTGIEMQWLQSNHEKEVRPISTMLDGVRYEHGHYGLYPASVRAVRRAYRGRRVVHGHTHDPRDPWPLDVGSVAFSRTYGEIIDGEAFLRWLS